MDRNVTPRSSSYAILRIKRKRTEEPLDALVVESSKRRKSKGGIGVFQFAETVEEATWRDEKQAVDLKSRLSSLARKNPDITPIGQFPRPSEATTTARIPDDDVSVPRRYTILKQDGLGSEITPNSRISPAPPKVFSSKELSSSSSDLTIYDAVLSPSITQPTIDLEMEKFQSLLEDYLKLNDTAPGIASSAATSAASPLLVSSGRMNVTDKLVSTEQSANDYVWDIFYHRRSTLPELTEAANIATVTGLPPSLNDPYDSDSDSDIEDEADEDSNAEDFYKNDYPEDESDSNGSESDGSDIFHEASEQGSDDPEDRFNPDEWR